jgi:hypothetical protein
LAASERVHAAVANRPGVAAGNKAAALSNDVPKRAASDADFQYTPIKKRTWWVCFQVEIIPES